MPKNFIGIVSSTGGPSALAALLPLLPSNLNATIVVIQHCPSFSSLPCQQAWLGMQNQG